MWKRYLTDTMLNLHARFLSENTKTVISYTSFTRLRPFFVVAPSVNDRDTVACKLHTNASLKADRLHKQDVLITGDVTRLMLHITCSVRNRECMYRECNICRDLMPQIYSEIQPQHLDIDTHYYEWCYKSEECRSTKGENINVKVQTKERIPCTLNELKSRFEKELLILMSHQYRILHQHSKIRQLKRILTETDCLLQIDFSQNYCCKAKTEIQSMHFGGNRTQITLHTTHATFSNGSGQSYCTMSGDLRHSPNVIWAHLRPILLELRDGGITRLHFLSDGPASQYKCRANFFMLSTAPFQMGFKHVGWNFESSHGKGCADGIGAVIKKQGRSTRCPGR